MSSTPVALTPVLDVEIQSSKHASYVHSSSGNTWNCLCNSVNTGIGSSDYLDSLFIPRNRKHMTMLLAGKKDNIIHVQTSEDCQRHFKNTRRSYCNRNDKKILAAQPDDVLCDDDNDSNDDKIIKKTKLSLQNFTLLKSVKEQTYPLEDSDLDTSTDDSSIDSREKYDAPDLDINKNKANGVSTRRKEPQMSAVDGKICMHNTDNGRAGDNSLNVTSDNNHTTDKCNDSSSFKAGTRGVCSDACKSKVDKIQDILRNADVGFNLDHHDRAIKQSFSNSSLMLYNNTRSLPHKPALVQLENCGRFQRRNALSDPEKMTMKQTTRERLQKDRDQRKKSLTRKVSNFLGARLNLNIEEELI